MVATCSSVSSTAQNQTLLIGASRTAKFSEKFKGLTVWWKVQVAALRHTNDRSNLGKKTDYFFRSIPLVEKLLITILKKQEVKQILCFPGQGYLQRRDEEEEEESWTSKSLIYCDTPRMNLFCFRSFGVTSR